MASRANLESWILSALRKQSGAATIIDVAKYIWQHHEADLRASDDLFYTWQYQMRWAAQRLQKAGKLKKTKEGIRARWVLLSGAT